MLGDRANLMQATQAGCMPAFQMHPKTGPWCRDFANVIVPWLTDHTPSMVILSGDWLPDLNSSRFEWLAESMRGTIKTLTDRGIRVVLIGPSIQFKTGLPSILIRSLARGDDEPPANEVVRSDLFDGDAKMKAAFPNAELFNYISVVEAACPNHRCPLVVNGDVPLVWDYGHLTVEGSQYVVGKISPFPNFAKARSEGM
jgi:hypothetical protein